MGESSVRSSSFIDLPRLIGCRNNEEEINNFLRQLNNNNPILAEVKSYPALKNRPACEYHNCKNLGISLCFEDSILQAIHIYNKCQGFSSYNGPLPFSIRMDMEAHEIVEVLGEPDGKMGGGRCGGPISIAYKDKGLQIDFMGCDWEDKHNTITCITIHHPVEI